MVRVWDAASGLYSPLAALKGGDNYVLSVCYSADNTRLVSTCLSEKTRMWDAASHELLAELEGLDNLSCICFSPDGDRLATCDDTFDNSCARVCVRHAVGDKWL